MRSRWLAIWFVGALLMASCSGSPSESAAPVDFYLTVQDLGGPPVKIEINGSVVTTTHCGDSQFHQLRPSQNGVPDLPWTVTVRASDGTEMYSTTLDGSMSHVLQIYRYGAYLDGPTSNPGVPPPGPCPSLYFDTPMPR